MSAPLEMDPAIRQRWADALRSGQYRQGHEVLRTADDCFCCLGVLCELAAADGVIGPARWMAHSSKWLYGEDGDVELPESVRAWAGLRQCNPFLPALVLGAGSLLAETPSRHGICDWCGRHRTVYAFALWACRDCLASGPAGAPS